EARAARGDAVHLDVTRTAGADARREAHQVRQVAAVDRQLAYFLRSQVVGLQRRGCIDQRRLSRDGDRLRERPDLEDERLAHRLAGAELHTLVAQDLEAGQLDLHGVRSARERREHELAVDVRHRLARYARAFVRGENLRA